ncbi:MAG: polyphosphate polymerase domain-containing protein [Tissierellia bacterium]|nr:polyphosphate polymerase domain-containing protein [Bacillota bacterium]NLL22545.1 polyphosphate polymerase domain-containing protein [Tissierellia bacterium]
MKARHELKYEISFADHLLLSHRLQSILQLDSHADAHGNYRVRSMYFDDPFDSALNEKMSGLNSREKWRVRCYNEDFSFIRLEKKSKRNNLCRKQSVRLSQQEVHSLMEGDILFMIDRKEDLLKELYFKMKSRLLRPCVIVEYTRIPFIHPAGNTRITLDSDIRTGIKNTDFFANNPLQVPTEEAYAVLEVKFDEFLPDFIARAVQIGPRRAGAFSKYAQSRKYD